MEKKKLEIIEFTDPVCTWCWGSEPILRKIETRFGNQVKIKYVMGGLVKDIRDFYDSYNHIGGDAERSNQEIAKHWFGASSRHGMPVKVEGFKLFSEDHPSTYPQNIAFKAAQFENQQLADKFLRRMREASASEAKQTNKQEILIELASEVGLDIAQFISRIEDGSAETEFKKDLQTTRKYGVSGFPAFLIRYGEKEMLIKSFQGFEAFKSIIQSVTNHEIIDTVPEKTEENLLMFIRKYGRVAPVEIQLSFDLNEVEVNELLEQLIEKNLCRKVAAGNGSFIEAMNNPTSCDIITGICAV
ncbi:DsbA family protein [Clostridium sp.]|uniref:DsbA family oxidoreductase n=1 Tax=Clostridium sp. TaxID=1506 RepID=UPI001A4C66A4|nr:DsbA family protein [Clostridium sp.]MBK5239643.1 DsbA family protein [Clostridium sp.]